MSLQLFAKFYLSSFMVEVTANSDNCSLAKFKDNARNPHIVELSVSDFKRLCRKKDTKYKMLWSQKHVQQKVMCQSLHVFKSSRASEKACLRTFQTVPLYICDK